MHSSFPGSLHAQTKVGPGNKAMWMPTAHISVFVPYSSYIHTYIFLMHALLCIKLYKKTNNQKKKTNKQTNKQNTILGHVSSSLAITCTCYLCNGSSPVLAVYTPMYMVWVTFRVSGITQW